MSSESRRKFSLGDIIRKLNEGQPPVGATEENEHARLREPAPASQKRAGHDPQAPMPASGLPPQPAFGPSANRQPLSAPPPPPPPPPPQRSEIVRPDAAPAAAPAPVAVEPRVCADAAVPAAPAADERPDAGARRPSVAAEGTDMLGQALSGAEEEEEEFDVFRYLSVIMRRKVPILVVTIAAAAYSVWTYLGGVKLYTARARMLYRPGQQAVLNDRQSPVGYWVDREKAINTHLVLLKSRTVLERVSEDIGHQVSPEAIASALTVTQGGDENSKNDIIEVAYKSTRADLARDVVNGICNSYIEYRREVNEQEKSRFIFKLQTQIEKVQADLNRKEDALRLFRENNRMVEMSSETNLAVQKFSSMDLARQETELALVETDKRYAATRNQLSEQERRIIESLSFNNAYQARLAELEMQLASLSAEYSAEHYKVRMVRQQIDSIRAAMKNEIQSQATRQSSLSRDPLRLALLEDMAKLAIEKTVLESKAAEQRKLISQLNAELLKLPALTQQYVNLQRETEAFVQTLRTLRQSLEEAKIIRDSQESDLKVLELAALPTVAVSSRKVNSIFIGILVGLILGIALAFLIEYLDQSLKNPADVEKILELPLLGFVPLIQAEKAMVDDSEKLAKSIIEPFRAVRANLKHLAAKYNMQALMVCSAVKGEGKTTLAANLAITFALDGRRVVLIDGDLRRPQLHKLFSLSKEIGVAEYLQGTRSVDEILKPTRYQGLSIITCGKQPDNPAELVGTPGFTRLVGELRSRMDVVLFDSPAILPVSDAITMAPHVDGILMVVRTFWTPIKAARQARNQLRRIGCNVFGAILNGVSHGRSYYPYYYGYYGYYSYKYSYDYDKEPRKGFSAREAGLAAESRIKDLLQNGRLYLPHYIARGGRFLRYLARRPLFWLLLSAAVGVSFLEATLRPAPDRLAKGIEYLDGVGGSAPMRDRAVSAAAGMALEQAGAPASDAPAAGQPEPGRADAGAFLRDSVRLWYSALNTGKLTEHLRFYDTSEFSFRDGKFADYRAQVRKVLLPGKPHTGIMGVDSVVVAGYRVPFCKTLVYTSAVSRADTLRRRVSLVWKVRDGVWRIVRQSEGG